MTSATNDEQRRQLAERIRQAQQRSQAALPPAIPARSWQPGDDLPLSFAQERLWFIDRLAPGSPIYNRPLALRLRGPFTSHQVRLALEAVVQRHASLRTLFPAEPGGLAVARLSQGALEWQETSLAGASSEIITAGLQSALAAFARRPFDLSSGPVLRACLFRLPDGEAVLELVVHHIAFDAWSAKVLANDLSALLNIHPLPPLPVQYADFAAWQRQTLSAPALQPLLERWQALLEGAPHVLELPADRPRPPIQSEAGGRLAFVIEPRLLDALRRLARRHDATLFMTLLSVYAVLLFRLTRQPDFVIGSPVAGRLRPELEPLVGLFVNMLPLRLRLSGQMTFADVLKQARQMCQDAFALQEAPFERLVEALRLPPDTSRPPLFQATFNLKNLPVAAPAPGAVLVEEEAFDDGLAPYDLSLELVPSADRLHGAWIFATALFDLRRIQSLRSQYLRLLHGVLQDDQTPIGLLPWLDEAEQRRVLDEWNHAPAHYPELDIAAVFSRQAAQTPQALAVIDGDQRLTFAELDAASDRLGRLLVGQGIQPGEPVALFLPRSAHLITATLGVLKAGAAYLPLDITYPPERLRFMLEDSGARLLIAGPGTPPPPTVPGLTLLHIDALPEPAPAALPSAIPLDSVSHLLYTSGSTGRPKGVPLTHRGVLRLFPHNNYWTVQPGQRVSQISSPSFDGATIEIWGALLNGACLVIPPQYTLLDPHALARFWREQRVDHAYTPTALFNLIAAICPDAFQCLKTISFGGEAGSVQAVQQVLAAGHAPSIFNLYGPAEITVMCSAYSCPPALPEAARLPVGFTLSGNDIYLLDEQQQPVPVGVPGEIYLGGEGLSPGYWKRPDLTAERFPILSVAGRPPQRLYRTGDLGCWRFDGNLDVLGRLDTQVKLRGYRIELAEIEQAAQQAPAVLEAAAVLRDDPTVGKRLALYLTLAESGAPADALAHVRPALARHLPGYMLPSIIQVVERLPRNPNGKVDRLALAALPVSEPADLSPLDQPPQGALESLLAGAWSAALGVSAIHRQADFFALGGHSLLAVRLTAQINDLLGLDLPVRLILESPQLAAYAAAVRSLHPDPAALEQWAVQVLELLSLSEEEAEKRNAQSP